MKNLIFKLAIIWGLFFCAWALYADQFNVMGRDLIRTDATGVSLAYGSGEIVAFSSYATSSVAQVMPEKYPKIPVFLSNSNQPDSLYACSTSASDTQIMTVDGLNEDWERQIRTVTLNGSNKVRVGTASTYWRRVNFVSVNSPIIGTARVIYGVSSGINDSTKTVALIKTGQSKSLIALFTTWKDFSGAIQYWTIDPLKRGAGASPDTSWGMAGILARTQADTSWKPLFERGINQSKGVDVQFVQSIPLLPKMDLYVAIGVTNASMEVVTNLGIGGQ